MVKKSLKLPENYTMEMAIENGDVIELHGNVTNVDKLEKFIEDVNKGKKAFVRTLRYIIEGDPIIYIVYYNGEIINAI